MKQGAIKRSAAGLRTVALATASIWASLLLAEPPPLDAYGNLPGVEDMTLSPSGTQIATVARLNGLRRLLVLDSDRALSASLTLGDLKMRGVRWVSEDRLLLVSSTTIPLGYGFAADKQEFYAGVLVSAKDGTHDTVFSGRRGILQAIFGNYGARSFGGRHYGYFGGIELANATGSRLEPYLDHGRPSLFSVDLDTNTPHRIAGPPPADHWNDWLIGQDGAIAAKLDMDSKSGNWTITNSGRRTIATGKEPLGQVELVGFGNDGTTLVYSRRDVETSATHLFEVPLAGGSEKEYLTDINVEEIFIDDQSGRILGYIPEQAKAQPVMFDPAQQAIIRKVYQAFPNRDLRIAEWTPGFTHFLVHTSGSTDSGSWFIVDIAKRRADVVGADYPLIGPEAVGAISTISYKAGDGLALDGILTLPPGREAKNLPVILLPHGGPNAQDTERFDWWAQAFASRGYAVFQPNFRGSTNRDTAFMRAGNGEWGRKMQTDISDGLAELVRRGIADPKRACIVGASYGGYAALAGVTLQKGLYRCAVAVAPVSDLSDMYWTDYRQSGGNRMLRRSLNDSLGPLANFAAVSPRRHARDASAPILLVHGKDDTVVSFKQSSAMADALKEAGKPYEMVVLREEDHWLSRSATRQQMLDAAMRFVSQHNPAP